MVLRVAAVFVVCAAAMHGQTTKRPQKAHPELEAGIECQTCHDSQWSAWNDSEHGLALVKCVACHGYPGQNLTAKPTAAKCQSCHPVQADTSSTPCQSCHPAHTFRTHAAKGAGASK